MLQATLVEGDDVVPVSGEVLNSRNELEGGVSAGKSWSAELVKSVSF
jgi:hypothetical protein